MYPTIPNISKSDSGELNARDTLEHLHPKDSRNLL